MPDTLADIIRAGRRASDCAIVSAADASPGGVDPLGLRQINFDLMNEVFPGLNNVARHIRPFTVVTWAWRRTMRLAREKDVELKVSVHEDFVARVEVAFLWSMLLREQGGDVDLPGKQRVKALWGEADRIDFGDEEWTAFVKARRNSTAFTAAVNYGPGLRSLGLLDDDPEYPGVRVPGHGTTAMLDAFETQLGRMLRHDLFNGWGPCSLTRGQAASWAASWDIDEPTDEESASMEARLAGPIASRARQAGFSLLREAIDERAETDEAEARLEMCLPGGRDDARSLSWRRMQTRQAFRLALEGLLEWIVAKLGSCTMTTTALVVALAEEVGGDFDGPAIAWLESMLPTDASPVSALVELERAYATRSGVALAIVSALATCLMADRRMHDGSTQGDRLPLAMAVADLAPLRDRPARELLAHAIERWVIAQHAYWSVGRGLADARAGGKSILRLRVLLEPDGWRVTRGRGSGAMPRATPDRLRTAMSLATEAGILGGAT